jgi:protein O-mannosyl-transferase
MLARTRAWLWLAILIAICIALYWPTLQGPFLFDDFPNLSALDSIDHLSNWRDLGIYLSQPRSFPGRPIAMLSFLLQKSAWPDHPLPFRLVNIAIHLLNGVLVFLLARRIAQQWFEGKVEGDVAEQRANLAACLAAAGFLLNPIQLSGVVLVVQRMTLLMALFTLLGLLAYLRGLSETSWSTMRRGAWLVFGLGVCTGPAFLSKENGILLPLYALALDSTVLRESVRRLPPKLRWLRRLLIWPTVLFVLGYLLWQIPGQWGAHGIRDFTLGERLLTEPRVLVSYLDKIFLPRFGLYGLYHDDFVVSRGLATPWTTCACLIGLLGALALVLLGRRRWPLLTLAILWYLGGQLLESSTVMLELYFEHRNYLPLAGVIMAASAGIAQIESPRRRRLCLLTAGLWIVACSITTGLSARVYMSEDRLATAWASTAPHSIRAQSYLADRLFKHRQIDAALHVIAAIEAYYPSNSGLVENRVYLLCMQGRLTSADINRMNGILSVAPFDRSGFENMKALRELAATKRCPALDDSAWLKSVDILLGNPAYKDDGLTAGFLHYQKHFWAVQHGRLDMAIEELDQTYRNDPDPEIPRLQAKYLVSAGLYDQAIAILRNTDYKRLPLLRRLLVDDRAINAADIVEIEKMKQNATKPRGPSNYQFEHG